MKYKIVVAVSAMVNEKIESILFDIGKIGGPILTASFHVYFGNYTLVITLFHP